MMSARAMLLSGPTCILSVALLLVMAPGCATVDRWTDARIEAEVKARLVAEHDANLTRLGVLSSNGTVYLSGRSPQPTRRPAPKPWPVGCPRCAASLTHCRLARSSWADIRTGPIVRC